MKCAYCEIDKKTTREHIIPNGFLKRMDQKNMITWSEAAPIRVIKSDPVIKDVCAECNNGELSKLDSYGLEFILNNNRKVAKNNSTLVVKYDYNKLKRWLLKVCFNASRANNRKYDTSVYDQVKSYILGESEQCENVEMFLSYMDLTSNSDRHGFYHLDGDDKYQIDHFRITQVKIPEYLSNSHVIRCVMINSFSFILSIKKSRFFS